MSCTRTYIFLVVTLLLICAGTGTGAVMTIRTDIRQVTTASTLTPVPATPAATVTCICPARYRVL